MIVKNGVIADWSDGCVIIESGARQIILREEHAMYAQDIIAGFDLYHGTVEQGDIADYRETRQHKVCGCDEFPGWFSSIPEILETARQYLGLLEIAHGDVVLDLGAYCGLSAYWFHKAGGVVTAVEPDPKNFEMCRKNLGGYPIALVNAAVSDKTGTMLFNAEGSLSSCGTDMVGPRMNVVEVPTIRLSELGPADCIKMDIEGAEIKVLAEAEQYLREFRPRLVIEPHTHQNGKKMLGDVLNALDFYDCEVVRQPGCRFPLVIAK